MKMATLLTFQSSELKWNAVEAIKLLKLREEFFNLISTIWMSPKVKIDKTSKIPNINHLKLIVSYAMSQGVNYTNNYIIHLMFWTQKEGGWLHQSLL